MSQAHLNELKAALYHRGWLVTERTLDEDVRGSATWEVQRPGGWPMLLIDFDGFGGLGEDIRVEQAAGCSLRGHSARLYFWRIVRGRERWNADLAGFIESLDAAVRKELGNASP